MGVALDEARDALKAGYLPVGAVVARVNAISASSLARPDQNGLGYEAALPR